MARKAGLRLQRAGTVINLTSKKQETEMGHALTAVVARITAMMMEGIVPFVCFGYGCDFADESSILDRVITMAMFGPLNEICVVNVGEGGVFNRGSFFFQEPEWSRDQMEDVMYEIANRAIHYYFAKLGETAFPGSDAP